MRRMSAGNSAPYTHGTRSLIFGDHDPRTTHRIDDVIVDQPQVEAAVLVGLAQRQQDDAEPGRCRVRKDAADRSNARARHRAPARPEKRCVAGRAAIAPERDGIAMRGIKGVAVRRPDEETDRTDRLRVRDQCPRQRDGLRRVPGYNGRTARPARIKADRSSASTLLQTIMGSLRLARALRSCTGERIVYSKS